MTPKAQAIQKTNVMHGAIVCIITMCLFMWATYVWAHENPTPYCVRVAYALPAQIRCVFCSKTQEAKSCMTVIHQIHLAYTKAIKDQDGERALWLRVLLQQAADATTRQKHGTANARKNAARFFLQKYSTDFITICDYAGLHPERCFQGFKALFAMREIPPMPPLDIKVNEKGQLYIADWVDVGGGDVRKKRKKPTRLRRKDGTFDASNCPSLFAVHY